MKKYEKIIQTLIQIDKKDYETWQKQLTFIPGSDEWKALGALQDELERQAEQEFAALNKCITWYRQRTKTAEDVELVAELESTYDEFYEHMICDLTDTELDEMATEAASKIIKSVNLEKPGTLNEKEVPEPEKTTTEPETPAKMQNDEAIEVLNQMFEEKGWSGDTADGIIEVLTKGIPLSKRCEHAITTELDRLGFEIPFQRNWMKNQEEHKQAVRQKEALELVLKCSAAAEQNAKSQPDAETVKIFTLKLVLSQMERESVTMHEIERIQRNLEDEQQELVFMECLFGEETPQYKAILNEIAEWEKLLDSATKARDKPA